MNKMQMKYLETVSGGEIISIQEGILKRKGQNATIPKITDYRGKSYDFSYYPEISEKIISIPKNYYSNNFLQNYPDIGSTSSGSNFDEVSFGFTGEESNKYIKYVLSISNFRAIDEMNLKSLDDTSVTWEDHTRIQCYLNTFFESSKDLYINCVFFNNRRFPIVRVYEIFGDISKIENGICFGLETIEPGETYKTIEKYPDMFNKIYDSRFHDYIKKRNHKIIIQSNTSSKIHYTDTINEYYEWKKKFKENSKDQ